MSKQTSKGNKRRGAKAEVMKGNARTVGATNYAPTAAKGKGKAKTDKSAPVPARNVGKKGSGKASGKSLPAFLQKKGKK